MGGMKMKMAMAMKMGMKRMAMKKSVLKKNKSGKIVSVKKSAAGKKAFKHISKWSAATKALQEARTQEVHPGEEGNSPLQDHQGDRRKVNFLLFSYQVSESMKSLEEIEGISRCWDHPFRFLIRHMERLISMSANA